MTETLLLAAIIVPCLIVAIVFHEVSHGWAALALGDPTAKEQRRLSFNPIRHVDPFGTVILPGMLYIIGAPPFGWAKPVPVNQRRLTNPRYGMMAVAAAGPAMNVLLATVGAVALGLLAATGDTGMVTETAATGLQVFILINIVLALFNMLPIPPLDGSHVVEGLLPRKWARHYGAVRKYGFVFLIILLLADWYFLDRWLLNGVVGPPVGWLMDQFIAIAAWTANLTR
ncbi:site-2 protease family protein [Paraurantiacibacter namhicola]|uniref:Peptidase family M50 n=1 Tax=Paraurantiacibacter namhicola TaxID=645517 RepID=A0A1C7DAF0_9SPHN|nr:site-2 protease family protein [Paraurantiacibacter namhicola]ANU08470.1 Peptidase family M50 [Paraurantiacibacter namhicola]